MKLKEGFVLRDVAGSCVVVPTGTDLNFNGMISLNDTGKVLWQRLETDATIDDLVIALTAEFDVDEATAKAGAERFVEKLRQHGFIEE